LRNRGETSRTTSARVCRLTPLFNGRRCAARSNNNVQRRSVATVVRRAADSEGIMLKELDSFDWKEAFGYAGEPNTSGSPRIQATITNTSLSITPFTREDVIEIVGLSEGEGDGPDWLAYGCLRDGRWFYLEAGCDYTGWDCQADGFAIVGGSREDIEQFALTDQARERFGVAHAAAA